MRQLRTMKRGDAYEIEERIGDGDWMPIAERDSIEEAKNTLKALRALEEIGEE